MRHIRPAPDLVNRLASTWLTGRGREPAAVRVGADQPPTPVPDGVWSHGRVSLVRWMLSDHGPWSAETTSPARWQPLDRHAVPDATAADAALIVGSFADAGRGYRAELAATPGKPTAWAAWGSRWPRQVAHRLPGLYEPPGTGPRGGPADAPRAISPRRRTNWPAGSGVPSARKLCGVPRIMPNWPGENGMLHRRSLTRCRCLLRPEGATAEDPRRRPGPLTNRASSAGLPHPACSRHLDDPRRCGGGQLPPSAPWPGGESTG